MIADPKHTTEAQAAQIEFCAFPGGYSPAATKGDCTFNTKAAMLAINLAPRYFQHTRGTTGPLVLEQWQKNIFGTLFGWKRPDGTRRYRIAYIEVPRGNGKSTMCMVMVGNLMYLDDEPGAEIFSAAGTRDQAHEVFRPFKMNVLMNPTLKRISQPYINTVTRIDPNSGLPMAVYKAIAADAEFQHGGAPHGIIFDELHVQKNRDLWDVLHTGTIKQRRQPLTVAITTAGFDKHSICYEQHEWACKVRDGLVDDPEFLPVIYAAAPDDDWTAPETWAKANPNLGVSIKVDDLAKECKRAQEIPGYENTFKRLHLNLWTEQDVRWLPMDKWDECGKEPVDMGALAGQLCHGGLDLSTTTDITALVLYFPETHSVVPYFWIPEEGARKRAQRDRVPYDVWIREGHIRVTPGNVVDYDVVRADINELFRQFYILNIARDRWNSTQITSQLMGDGIEMLDFGQGFASMNAPSKELEKLVVGELLRHGGNPVLRWMASNVAAETDAAGNIKPSKKKSTERIDGIVSLVMAIGAHTQSPNAGVATFELI